MKTIFAALIALLVISTNRAFAADQFNHFNVSLGGSYAFSQVTQDPDPVHTQGITFDQTASPLLQFEYKQFDCFGLELSAFGEEVKPTAHGGGVIWGNAQHNVITELWGNYDAVPTGWTSGYIPVRTTWNDGTQTLHLALQPKLYYNTKWLSGFVGGGIEYSHLWGDYEGDGWTGSAIFTDATWKIRYDATVAEWTPIASLGLQGHFGKHFSLTATGEWTAEKQEVRFKSLAGTDAGNVSTGPVSFGPSSFDPTPGQLLATIENPWRANLIVSYSF